jgi:ribose transport system permease protein
MTDPKGERVTVGEKPTAPMDESEERLDVDRPLDPGTPERVLGVFRRTEQADFLARFALVGVWIALAGVFAILVGGTFLSSGTLKTIFGGQEPLVFLGMAAVVTFAVGEFDLSIAALLGLSATLVPVLVTNEGWAPLPASLVAVAAAVAAGSINSIIIVILGIDAIIVTLGMATFLSGVSSLFSGSVANGGLSSSFASIANQQVLGLPITFFYGVALVLALTYLMRFTPLGRHMNFVGANREVARLAGVRVRRIRMGSYIASGLICGVGGVLLAASVGGFDSTTAPTYLLPALSATFLGTSAIWPGKFNPIGTFIGIYLLATGIVGLQLLGASGWVSDVFYGAGLVTAVIVATVTRRRSLTE